MSALGRFHCILPLLLYLYLRMVNFPISFSKIFFYKWNMWNFIQNLYPDGSFKSPVKQKLKRVFFLLSKCVVWITTISSSSLCIIHLKSIVIELFKNLLTKVREMWHPLIKIYKKCASMIQLWVIVRYLFLYNQGRIKRFGKGDTTLVVGLHALHLWNIVWDILKIILVVRDKGWGVHHERCLLICV